MAGGKGKNFSRMGKMSGKGKNLSGLHQKILQKPKVSAAPKVTLEDIQSKRNIPKNQALIDLDKAEDSVLSLLNICASTTDQLAAMAEGIGGSNGGGQGSDDKSSVSSTSISTSTTTIIDQRRITKVQKNGYEFREKLKEIHDLLAPHKHLVVDYKAFASTTIDSVEQSGQDGSGKTSDGNNSDKKDEAKKEEKIENNMYASRLEMRLAIERRNLLKDMLKLEKKRRLEKSTKAVVGSSADNQKRKREE